MTWFISLSMWETVSLARFVKASGCTLGVISSWWCCCCWHHAVPTLLQPRAHQFCAQTRLTTITQCTPFAHINMHINMWHFYSHLNYLCVSDNSHVAWVWYIQTYTQLFHTHIHTWQTVAILLWKWFEFGGTNSLAMLWKWLANRCQALTEPQHPAGNT